MPKAIGTSAVIAKDSPFVAIGGNPFATRDNPSVVIGDSPFVARDSPSVVARGNPFATRDNQALLITEDTQAFVIEDIQVVRGNLGAFEGLRVELAKAEQAAKLQLLQRVSKLMTNGVILHSFP